MSARDESKLARVAFLYISAFTLAGPIGNARMRMRTYERASRRMRVHSYASRPPCKTLFSNNVQRPGSFIFFVVTSAAPIDDTKES